MLESAIGASFASCCPHVEQMPSNFDPCAKFDDPPRWNLEKLRRIRGVALQDDEDDVLPKGQPHLVTGREHVPPDKEGCASLVLPDGAAAEERGWHIRRFHITKAQGRPFEIVINPHN